MVHLDAPTWLDRELAARDPVPLRDAGFGREVRAAMASRGLWLVDQELADQDGGVPRLRANAMAVLLRRELLSVTAGVAEDLGKAFVETQLGDIVNGRFARTIEAASGRYALIEKSREFTLVPWRPVLGGRIGRQVSGIMRGDGVDWRLGRTRGGAEIS